MNISELNKLKSIGVNKEDLIDKVNLLQEEKIKLRESIRPLLEAKQEDINLCIAEIEKIEKMEKRQE